MRRDYPPIGDYAIIGDCRTAALVCRDGGLDWLCLPRFDSPAVFAALLDRARGGAFSVRPAGRFESRRRYVGPTPVLETTFEAAGGRLRVTDLMSVASEEDRRREPTPEHEVLRIVECVGGEVEVEVVCDPRPRFGAEVPRPIDRGAFGWCFGSGARGLILRAEVPLRPRGDAPGIAGRVRLRAGERRRLALTRVEGEPAVLPVLGEAADSRLARTLAWWRAWAGHCRYEGPHRDSVVRSALTLKLMTYAPSGAVLAAPTTSLPEHIGGVRNWDYRYCWLRDASLTIRALMALGYHHEADAFLAWMIHSTRLTWPELRVVYDVHGEARMKERTLDHLEGYRGSRPVRVGNDAVRQLQLDTYGEVVDAVSEYVRRGGRLDRTTARLVAGLGDTVCRRWREPDEGIWERRGGPRQLTHSKVMCWVALDRLLRLHRAGHLSVPVDRFTAERDRIRDVVEARGWDPRRGTYVSVLDGRELDASLLLLARYGYPAPPGRMAATAARIRERLGCRGLLYRYREDDGLPPGEGAFGLACFWDVVCRHGEGDREGALVQFDRLCRLGNDVGLYGEEIDPETSEPLGNFPQAFTHVGLIDAALTLSEAREGPP